MSLPPSIRPTTAVCVALVVALAGCSTVGDFLSGDKVDYRSSTKTSGLEVPPDLTQLSRDSRYQLAGGTVTASTFRASGTAAAAASPTPVVAPQAAGNFQIERLGNQRWLSTTLPPEQLYAQVRAFWKDNGFTLVTDRAEAGVLETDWAENRARLPQDFIRGSIGKVLDGLYSTGELDKFRTRVERTATGSEVYISHRGMVEVYVGDRKERTVWQTRPSDPQLEAEFLSRLMVKLGAKDEQARGVVAGLDAPAGPVRARLLEGRPSPTLQVDDDFDRAWRRVGLALDRSGFTVEDRDRAQGIYFVRYVDPKFAGREEPGFFSRLFSFGGKKTEESTLAKYRVKVSGEGAVSTVTVLDSQGKPENGAAPQRIATLLLDDLK